MLRQPRLESVGGRMGSSRIQGLDLPTLNTAYFETSCRSTLCTRSIFFFLLPLRPSEIVRYTQGF